MKLSQATALSGALAAVLIAASPTAVIAGDDGCHHLNGQYGPNTFIAVRPMQLTSGPQNIRVTIRMDDGRPDAEGTCSIGNLPIRLEVNFPDDGTIQAEWDGTTIGWTNGTTWTKY